MGNGNDDVKFGYGGLRSPEKPRPADAPGAGDLIPIGSTHDDMLAGTTTMELLIERITDPQERADIEARLRRRYTRRIRSEQRLVALFEHIADDALQRYLRAKATSAREQEFEHHLRQAIPPMYYSEFTPDE